jgi:hypothetical protein
MIKHSKPKFAKVLDWLEGKLPQEEAQAIAAQIAVADDETLADLNWLRDFLETSRKIKLASLPPHVRDELRRSFAETTSERGPKNIFGRMLASLTFDSRTQLAVTGIRSADLASSHRQLIFSTQSLEVALSVQAQTQDERLNLFGQIFPFEEVPLDSFSVQLLSGALEVGLTMADTLGEFNFERIQTGIYELILSTDKYEVLIPSIQL